MTMYADVLVVGGGFAGVWSAAAALRVFTAQDQRRSVVMVTPNDTMVIRPRLYEDQPEQCQVPLAEIFAGTDLHRLKGAVATIDHDRRFVELEGAGGENRVQFETLVLAAGSQIRLPKIVGADLLHHVDDMQGAIRLRDHLEALPDADDSYSAVVIGAGFTGLEVATEMVARLGTLAAARGARASSTVYLVDRADAVGPDLGPGPRPVIQRALDELGIQVALGRTIAKVDKRHVHLDDGTTLPARTPIWTGGVFASPLTAQLPGERDERGRLQVDDFLRLPEVPHVLVAGDVSAAAAEEGHGVMPSCQHAIPLGKFAGHNAAASLLGLPLAAFTPDPYATCLDLGPAGAVLTMGWDRRVEKVGQEAKSHKMRTNRERIYPPVNNPADLIRIADFRVSTRRQS
jgi:NADH dehydrogenase